MPSAHNARIGRGFYYETRHEQTVDTARKVLIDGEHTTPAVLEDFAFCIQVVKKNCVVVFHDFSVVQKGIRKICKHLYTTGHDFVPLKMEDEKFAIFFDRQLVDSDAYIKEMYLVNRNYLEYYGLKLFVRRFVPMVKRQSNLAFGRVS